MHKNNHEDEVCSICNKEYDSDDGCKCRYRSRAISIKGTLSRRQVAAEQALENIKGMFKDE